MEDAGGALGEKMLVVVFGMDCVSHEEIIPYTTRDFEPITHNLFHGLFGTEREESGGATLLRKFFSSIRKSIFIEGKF